MSDVFEIRGTGIVFSDGSRLVLTVKDHSGEEMFSHHWPAGVDIALPADIDRVLAEGGPLMDIPDNSHWTWERTSGPTDWVDETNGGTAQPFEVVGRRSRE